MGDLFQLCQPKQIAKLAK
jgi:hypothetical protein